MLEGTKVKPVANRKVSRDDAEELTWSLVVTFMGSCRGSFRASSATKQLAGGL